MPEITLRSDAVNVEALMDQIRARIREKRGVDYTEAEVRELASVKLQKFLDADPTKRATFEEARKLIQLKDVDATGLSIVQSEFSPNSFLEEFSRREIRSIVSGWSKMRCFVESTAFSTEDPGTISAQPG